MDKYIVVNPGHLLIYSRLVGLIIKSHASWINPHGHNCLWGRPSGFNAKPSISRTPWSSLNPDYTQLVIPRTNGVDREYFLLEHDILSTCGSRWTKRVLKQAPPIPGTSPIPNSSGYGASRGSVEQTNQTPAPIASPIRDRRDRVQTSSTTATAIRLGPATDGFVWRWRCERWRG